LTGTWKWLLKSHFSPFDRNPFGRTARQAPGGDIVSTLKRTWTISSSTLTLIQGDITQARTDAVVNAANPQLRGGGGVDGAIHKAAGPELLKAGKAIVEASGSILPGRAVITPGFNLPARHVIHAVGPIWSGGDYNEDKILRSAYKTSLDIAEREGLSSVAFPAISCGVYGFPVDRAAPVALKVLRQALDQGKVKHIEVYLFSEADYQTWAEHAERLFGPAGQ
jgi:O-acetyl-ADP-ribose deacetylase